MTVAELTNHLEAQILASGSDEREITGAWMCDIISLTLAKGFSGMAWITHQANMNALAAAHWKQAACVIFPAGIIPERDVIQQAEKEEIPLLSVSASAFDAAGEMYRAGVRSVC